MLSFLTGQDRQRGLRQRDADRASALGLVAMYPRHAPGDVDLLPLQPRHVRLPQPGGQRERSHGLQMVRQFQQQAPRLILGQVGDPHARFFAPLDARRGGQPAFAHGVIQHRRNRRRVAVQGGVAGLRQGDASAITKHPHAPLSALGIQRGVDCSVVDLFQREAGEVRVQPAQFVALPFQILEFAIGGVVQPSDGRVIP